MYAAVCLVLMRSEQVESCHGDAALCHSAISLPLDRVLCEAVLWTWQFMVVKIQDMKSVYLKNSDIISKSAVVHAVIPALGRDQSRWIFEAVLVLHILYQAS